MLCFSRNETSDSQHFNLKGDLRHDFVLLFHFLDEENEVPRGKVTFPRFSSQESTVRAVLKIHSHPLHYS